MMERYEYKVVPWPLALSMRDKDIKNAAQSLEDFLNEQGWQGWELCQWQNNQLVLMRQSED